MDGVTLGTVALAFAGWLAGFLTASVLDWRRTAERRLGVARVLLVEVSRISSQLGPERFVDAQIGGTSSVVPEVHPWVHTLLPESANIKPDVFGWFLDLDRVLENMAARLRDLRDIRNREGSQAGEAHASAERLLSDDDQRARRILQGIEDTLRKYVKRHSWLHW